MSSKLSNPRSIVFIKLQLHIYSVGTYFSFWLINLWGISVHNEEFIVIFHSECR